MHRILLVVAISSGILFGFSQIVFLNSSFENGYQNCSQGFAPKEWFLCGVWVSNCIIDTIPEARPDSATDGRFTANVSADNNYYGSFSQYTSCVFKKGIEYTFSFYLAAYIPTNNPVVFPYFSRGRVEIWLGNDTCQWQQQIFLSPLLDSVWVQYHVNFTPDSDYSYFFFRGHPPTTSPVLSTLMIDALSPVSISNAHQINTLLHDTLIPIGDTFCVNLQANTNVSYDSIWWEQQGIGVISNQINAGVYCVDSNTTFIVHIMGNDSTCAGYLPSSDTIHVKFYDPNGITEIAKPEIKIFPNPTGKEYGFFVSTNISGRLKIYNSTGQLISAINMIAGTNQLNTSNFSSGVYQIIMQLENGDVISRKVVIH